MTSMSDSLMATQPRMLEPSKPRPSSKVLFVEGLGGDGEVLPQAGEIHEAEIDGLDFLFADQGQNFFGGHGGRHSAQWERNSPRLRYTREALRTPGAGTNLLH